MADPRKVAVYCDRYLTSSAATELAAATFGTIVLSFAEAGDETLRQNIRRLGKKSVFLAIDQRRDRAAVENAIRYYAADGVELELGANVLEITDWVVAMGKTVIAAPADQPERWLDILRSAGPRMSWWNLQLYQGADYAAWVHALVESGLMRGDLAQSFVVPGYKLTWSTPDSIAHDLQGLKDYAPSLDGVVLRSYDEMQPRADEWMKAISNGLGTTHAA
jgi:hypothetical protein